jgi:hypothetical protein
MMAAMRAVRPAARPRAMDVDRAVPAVRVKRAMRMVQAARTLQAQAEHEAQTVQAVRVPARNPRKVPEVTMLTEPMERIARTQQVGVPVARTPEA